MLNVSIYFHRAIQDIRSWTKSSESCSRYYHLSFRSEIRVSDIDSTAAETMTIPMYNLINAETSRTNMKHMKKHVACLGTDVGLLPGLGHVILPMNTSASQPLFRML